ncbi:MAG TPA: ABC transporter ATP-binding protein [Vicinamibacteria bacterium]|nr:ABC transporter ATP-binding protein [Vicinamibacteria bacterium]
MSRELRAEGIGKVFPDGTRALSDVSFVAEPGRVLGLLGPSGCGKSTLLRIVAGLEEASEGRLLLDGERFDERPPGARGVGFVFQSYALYPHLSVRRNLSLALEVQGLPAEEVGARVRDTAARLGLESLLDRRPRQLSGGQQQRVALGRALARRPRLFLMDEPLSNLDALLREGMRSELKAMFRSLDAIVLYVTHDQAEALGLADEVLVLHDGLVRQRAAPLELYRRPADVFTAGFVGSPRMTLWRGARHGADLVVGRVRVPVPAGIAGLDLWVGARPEDVEVRDAATPDSWPARVAVGEPTGDRILLTLDVAGQSLRALAAPRAWPEDVHVRIDPAKRHWFDGSTGLRVEPA